MGIDRVLKALRRNYFESKCQYLLWCMILYLTLFMIQHKAITVLQTILWNREEIFGVEVSSSKYDLELIPQNSYSK